ncbi:hypothetical protein LXA43DRAFT_1134855 [Ganoderma leucocontextum]|nr:hypothetical protein LXA43DRAFT_1134855 [Ganoderma leucocontextum]
MSGVNSTPGTIRSTNHPVTLQETRQPGALRGWIHELHHKLNVSTDSPTEFLRKYVPSSVPYQPTGSIRAAFAKWTPEKGREVDDYPHLLAGFSALVASFPAHKRPSFIDSHGYVQHFPFSAFAHNHHDTLPDLAVSFPGQRLDAKTHPRFPDLAMIMEAKSKRKDDPFKARGLKHCKTLVQLAVNARNLMHAHGLTCAFVLGIYGNLLRICRFDHSGAVVSQPINLKDAEGLKVVQQFFWHFVHPTEDVPFVGWDPTVKKLTSEDQAWLKDRLNITNFDTEGVTRSMTTTPAAAAAVEPRAYILFKAIDVNGRLFSRATTVWYAIRDTRISLDGRLVDPPGGVSADDLKVRIIKDAWRQLVRRPENDFYRRLSIIPSGERVGLPSIVCGGDLGEKEVRDWESALYGAPTPTPLNAVRHQSRLSPPASPLGSLSSPPASLSASTSSLQLPVHRPMQQTFTWRQARGPKYWHRERSHMRFVVAEVGRPLTRFRSTKELATAVRDAMIGHRDAMRRGGILHRDISVGNILIIDDPEDHEQFCGFIHDFDYSSMSRNVPPRDISSLSATALTQLLTADDDDGQLKERTGTFLFMSDDLLDSPVPVVHDVHHDIHSFYWVLLWVVLRHTAHNMPRTKGANASEACARVFKQGDSEEAVAAKRNWFWKEWQHLVIHGNAPLTALMKEFGALVRASMLPPKTSLEYDAVLDVFDRALARVDWPTSKDHPVRYTLPTLQPVNGWVFEERTPKKPHARAHGNGKGKQREVVPHSGSDSDSEIDEEDFDEAYESDGEPDASSDGAAQDDANVASLGIHTGPYLPSSLKFDERLKIGDGDDDESEDAAEVSALIGYGEDEDIAMLDLDIEDGSARPGDDYGSDLPNLLERLNVADGVRIDHQPTPPPPNVAPSRKRVTSGIDGATAGPSRVTRAASRRAGAAMPAELNHDPKQRVGAQTRAQTRNGSESSSALRSEGSAWSGPRTRSAARGGNSGTTRSEGGSQTGSRGSRRAR